MSFHKPPARRTGQTAFITGYLDALSLVERLHRLLLDVIKDEFERVGILDINAVQALLLFNIGDHEVTAGELKTRGYYQGSNVSYNLKKLVEMGYMNHQRCEMDRPPVRVRLTEKGARHPRRGGGAFRAACRGAGGAWRARPRRDRPDHLVAAPGGTVLDRTDPLYLLTGPSSGQGAQHDVADLAEELAPHGALEILEPVAPVPERRRARAAPRRGNASPRPRRRRDHQPVHGDAIEGKMPVGERGPKP